VTGSFKTVHVVLLRVAGTVLPGKHWWADLLKA
jgi:hypothetical protein